MALRNQPYIPLYVQDYLTDEKLNECSPATQGVYIKLLCVLHKMDEYGTILLKQSDKQTSNQIKNFACKFAKQIAFSVEIIESALNELIANGVMTINGDILFQKRMVKDNGISVVRSEAGKKGGEKTQFAYKFAKAKPQANSEYEYENENGNENINRIKKDKTKFLDSVLLTQDQYEKLKLTLGQKVLDSGIEKLDYSITVKGGKYKDHYKTLLNWHKRGFLTEDKKDGQGFRNFRTGNTGSLPADIEESTDATARKWREAQKTADSISEKES